MNDQLEIDESLQVDSQSTPTESADMQRFTQFAVDNLSDAAYLVEPDASIIYVNRAACKMLGYTQAELMRMRIYDMNPDIPKERWPAIWQLLKQEGQRTFEGRHCSKNGRVIPIEISANLLVFDGREYSCAFIRDITERKQLEERVIQSEKMQALTQLAGGVAHDFNNQLAGISGYADLLQEELVTDSTSSHYLTQIHCGVQRAADLTKQLLAFSRLGQYHSERLEFDKVVGSVVAALDGKLGERITLTRVVSDEVAFVEGDASQLQSAIMNLAVNACDAMPQGGLLTIASENVELDASFCAQQAFQIEKGRYVSLTVSDTGSGMSAEVLAHAFEPFFSTKPMGQGTGLGLSAVYGTVKNHRGAIQLRSEESKGTVAQLYLPRMAAGPVALKKSEPSPSERMHVMVVEDEPTLRDVATSMLKTLRCTVVSFENGLVALEYYRHSFADVDLVLLDMRMPLMGGKETYHALRAINPKVKVLLASGFTQASDAQELLADGARGFIQKPYRKAELEKKLGSLRPSS